MIIQQNQLTFRPPIVLVTITIVVSLFSDIILQKSSTVSSFGPAVYTELMPTTTRKHCLRKHAAAVNVHQVVLCNTLGCNVGLFPLIALQEKKKEKELNWTVYVTLMLVVVTTYIDPTGVDVVTFCTSLFQYHSVSIICLEESVWQSFFVKTLIYHIV